MFSKTEYWHSLQQRSNQLGKILKCLNQFTSISPISEVYHFAFFNIAVKFNNTSIVDNCINLKVLIVATIISIGSSNADK